jgi:hypothetical protein
VLGPPRGLQYEAKIFIHKLWIWRFKGNTPPPPSPHAPSPTPEPFLFMKVFSFRITYQGIIRKRSKSMLTVLYCSPYFNLFFQSFLKYLS